MKNKILILVVLLLSVSAFASKEVGNGGDDIALEFYSAFQGALKFIRNSPLPEFKKVSAIDFSKMIPDLKIVTVNEILETNLNEITQESTAMNFPKNQLIKINRDRWRSIEDIHIKESLALHEMLSLMGVESTAQYPVSSKYSAIYGISDSDFKQKFKMVIEKLEYRVGEDVYSLFAKERWIKSPSYSRNVRIDYTLSKNGKEIPPVDSGGSMMACASDERPLPEKFVQILSVDGSNIGFAISGLGGCGNPTMSLFQFLLPGIDFSSSPRYLMTEIMPKDDFILRRRGNIFQIWFVDEKGICGTALNFFIPRVLEFSPKRLEIKEVILPSDISQIPKMGYKFDLFTAYFLSGIKLHDSNSISISKNYFTNENDFIERNRYCGLPTTLDEVQTKAAAMKELSQTLDYYGN